MGLSSRHHYIPIYYLKGFLNNNSEFAIFDKKNKVLKKGYFSPRTHFFEYDRNIVQGAEGLTDSLEGLYAMYDDKIARLFEMLRNIKERKDILNPRNILELKLFISMMFWRIPETDDLYEQFFEDKSFQEIGFTIMNKYTNEESVDADAIANRLYCNPSFRKTCRFLVLPLNTFEILLKESDVDNWNYYYSEIVETGPLHLCGDNPIVFKDINNFFNFEDDLILPVSSNKTLVFSRGIKPKMLKPEFKVELDLILFSQASRYVCGPNREYLGKIADMYYENDEKISFQTRKNELFNYLR